MPDMVNVAFAVLSKYAPTPELISDGIVGEPFVRPVTTAPPYVNEAWYVPLPKSVTR